ncbi:MAG: hypothetical protein RLZZ210_792 [Pseudomonadota bacterium]|jgi:superfamily II DNA/RNA helicase
MQNKNTTSPADTKQINPELAQSFSDMNIDEKLLKAIKKFGYTQPTAIQSQAIPSIINQHDVLASAQTGSGKTAAFVIPIIQRLLKDASDSPSPAKHPVRALILAPTRELAQQIYDVFAKFIEYTPLRIVTLLGGESMPNQKQLLQKGVDIVIATPGRLYDHVNMNNIQLGKVDILTLDEADRMLDMGFLPEIEKIISYLPQSRQTLLFSATFSEYITKLTKKYQKSPIVIKTHSVNSSNVNVKQSIYLIQEYQRFTTLKRVLYDNNGQCIVFTNSKIDCKKLQQQLNDNYTAVAIHGDMTQSQRIESLQAFKDNKIRILVATDVAARGLDIAALPLVINYHIPYHAEDYVHRIGRTGRAGQAGLAISICSDKEVHNKDAIEKLIGKNIIETKTPERNSAKEANHSAIKSIKYTISGEYSNKYTRNKVVSDCALFRLKTKV